MSRVTIVFGASLACQARPGAAVVHLFLSPAVDVSFCPTNTTAEQCGTEEAGKQSFVLK